jgi:hypothetical protein
LAKKEESVDVFYGTKENLRGLGIATRVLVGKF